MNKYLINNGLMTPGIYRAFVIKRVDSRVYIPGLMIENVLTEDGLLDETLYNKVKESLPKALYNSKALENIVGSNPEPCWVIFENGDSNRPIVMGFFGKGVKSVTSGGITTGSYYTNNNTNNTTSINITGMSDILLVAGHGNGDPGACANGLKEADLTREVVSLLSAKMNCDVYDTSKNMFKDLTGSAATDYLKNYKVVMEIHFNATIGGYGSELLVRNVNQPTNIENEVLNALVDVGFTNRGFKDGNWLGNMTKSINAGVSNYFLVEICFIDSVSDMALYQEKKNTIIDNIANVFNRIIDNNSGPVTVDTLIMGQCVATYNQMITYLRKMNPSAPDYVNYYISEGAAEGVRGDIAFAQSCVETGHWTFTGDVTADQNNFAGIGTTGNGVKGEYFDSPQLGIRAQIQHLKAYASKDALKGNCVDPRFSYVNRGCATKIGDLGNGKWASDSQYANKIIKILNEILK